MKPAHTVGRKQSWLEIRTHSPAETQNLGVELAQLVPVPGVILLMGSLGTGKTTLTRGIALGLGVEDAGLVNSPSFTLVNIYHGRCQIYHLDLYRLSGARDLYSTGIDDFLGKDGVTIVEWGERLVFPVEAAIKVELEDAGDDSRILRVSFNRRRSCSLFGLGSRPNIAKKGKSATGPKDAGGRFAG